MTDEMSRRRAMQAAAGIVGGALAVDPAAATETPTDEEDCETAAKVAGLFAPQTYLFSRIVCFLSGVGDTISREEAKEVEAANLHQEIYLGIERIESHTDGFLAESYNYVQPNELDSGSLMNAVYSIINRVAFESLKAGESSSAATFAAEQEVYDYIAERQQNYIRQANQWISDIFYFLWFFAEGIDAADEDLTLEEHSASDSLPTATFGTHPSGLVGSDVFDNVMASTTHTIDEITPRINEVELANGETIDSYAIMFTESGGDRHLDPMQSTVLDLRMQGPSSLSWPTISLSANEGTFGQETHWYGLLDGVDQLISQIQSELIDYVEGIYANYDAGDINLDDLLDAPALMDQFSDAQGMTRAAAEMVALGYSGADYLDTQVTVNGSDFTEERTGSLWLRWDFETLADWEFGLDARTFTLQNLDESAVYSVEFGTSGTIDVAGNQFTAVDADGNVIEEDDDAAPESWEYQFATNEIDADETINQVTVDAEGSTTAVIPVDQTVATADYHSGMFVYEDDEGTVQRVILEGDWTLLGVERDDEQLDELRLSQYNNVERDPAKSFQYQIEVQEDRQSVADLDGLFGIGGDGSGPSAGSVLGIIGILAVVAGVVKAFAGK